MCHPSILEGRVSRAPGVIAEGVAAGFQRPGAILDQVVDVVIKATSDRAKRAGHPHIAASQLGYGGLCRAGSAGGRATFTAQPPIRMPTQAPGAAEPEDQEPSLAATYSVSADGRSKPAGYSR
jgi:hypothetical protein